VIIYRWRKRPVEIETVQFTGFDDGGNGFDLLHWIDDHGANAHGEGGEIIIRTLEGNISAQPGDYIVRGTQNEFYPVKPAVFAAVYEAEPTGVVET